MNIEEARDIIAGKLNASAGAMSAARAAVDLADRIGDGSTLTGAHFPKLTYQERDHLARHYPERYAALRAESEKAGALAEIAGR